MKSLATIVFLIVTTNTWCQEIKSTLNNDKIKIYHEGLNKTRLLLSTGETEQALDNMIEVLKLDIGYGDDAYLLLPRFLENIPKEDSIYLNKISEFSLLLSKCGITYKEIETIFNIVNKYGNQFRADSLKSKYHISFYVLKTVDIIDKDKFQKNVKVYEKLKKINFDSNLSKELKVIGKIDQKNRIKGRNSHQNDSIVYTKLKEIILRNNGFPNFFNIDKNDYEIIETCLIHMDLEKLVEFLPYLIKGIQKGEIFINQGILYAIDRNSIENGKYLKLENDTFTIVADNQKIYNQYYCSGVGAFYFYSKDNKKDRYLFPLTDKITKNNINNLRAIMYLPSIEDDVIIQKLKTINLRDFNNLFLNNKLIMNTYL